MVRLFSPVRPLGQREFIGLSALSTSLVAMATDSMLPSLGVIARELRHVGGSAQQNVITSFFAGLAIGQLVFGPLSDRLGRRIPYLVGLSAFIAGCTCSAMAHGYPMLIAGRVLAGVGAAAPRVLTLAIARDLYAGTAMARVMSFVSAVFIVVPAVAPSAGKLVADAFGWRAVFCLLAGVAVLNLSWFALRQPETLSAPSARGQLLAGVRSALAEPAFLAGTLGAGCVFGAFITYLSTAQSIFADVYGESARFPLLFAALALALGAGSLLNARRLRVRPLRQVALRGLAALVLSAAAALAVDVGYDGAPPLALFMLLMGGVFFVHGPSFGNLTALALQPLGRCAGLAASLSGSLATAIGFVVGRAFGASYAGRVTVVHVAFLCAALVAFAAVRLLGRRGE